MMRVIVFLCWILSLVVLASLVASGFGWVPKGWLGSCIDLYRDARNALPVGLPAVMRDLALMYLLFGIVEKAVSEWAYAYAGLVEKYKSRKAAAKAGRFIGAVSGVLLWPMSIALDLIAVLVWNRDAGEAARDASEQTLRSLRFGLTRDEVADVVDRYGRLTYMARPLFVSALCFSYVIVMLLGFSLGG